MTAIAVPCPPPGADRIHDRLATETDLDDQAIASLIAAVCQDACRAAVESGGEAVAVPLDPVTAIPGWGDVAGTVETIADSVDDGGALPVGPTVDSGGAWAVRALSIASDRSEAASIAILAPLSPMIQRRHVDAAAMRLRSHDVVLGPTSGSGWYFLGLDRAIDQGLPDAIRHVHAVARRAVDDGRSLGTIPFLPGYRSGEELEGVIALLEIASWTDDGAAPYTRHWLDDDGLSLR